MALGLSTSSDRIEFKKKSPKDLQDKWEELMVEYQKDSCQEKIFELEDITLSDETKFQASLFANYLGVGITLLNENKKIQYMCNYFEGLPEGYGKMLVAEPRINIESFGETNLSIPLEHSNNEQLMDTYGSFMVQALANSLEKDILYSFEIGNKPSDRKGRYLENGFNTKKHYSQFIEKVFKPELNNQKHTWSIEPFRGSMQNLLRRTS
jgi:hypothetical protein